MASIMSVLPIAFTLIINGHSLLLNEKATTQGEALKLVMLDLEEADKRGAHCLDGSPPAFYYLPASKKANRKKWVIFMKGGEWCEDEEACAKRANSTLLGSTKQAGQFMFTNGAPFFLSKAPWSDYNRVLLWYCDGGLFGGDRDEPENGLYYQGKRILDFQLDTLMKPEYGLKDAEEVMLAGNSAGGLSVYLHADHVASVLSPSTKLRAVPISGFFVPREEDQITEAVSKLYKLHDLSSVVKPECKHALPLHQHYLCVFANYTYPETKTPMFPIQTPLDGFAFAGNRLFKRSTLWCMVKEFEPELCKDEDINDLNGIIAEGVKGYRDFPKAAQAGEGGFIMSCPGHMMYPLTGSDKVEIYGKSMENAVAAWWEKKDSKESNWYLPCNLNSKPPHQCNPSCHAAPPAASVVKK